MDACQLSEPEQPQPNVLLEKLLSVLPRIDLLRERARQFCYAVVLFQRKCTACGAEDLVMLHDSWCRCAVCGNEFDPTLAFQTCTTCDSRLRLKINRYWCPCCRVPVRSRFSFDGHVFDAEYFREKMKESRQRRKAQIEDVRKMLAASRSEHYAPEDAPALDAVPGLEAALDQFVGQSVQLAFLGDANTPPFDLERYRQHIRDLADGCTVNFDGISSLIPDPKLDRIFRFIAAVFMENAGEVTLEQDPDGHITVIGV